MRSAITTILVLVLIFLFGWTVYKFVAKRAEEIRNAPDTAPTLVAASLTPVPATKPTATPAPTVSATSVPAGSKAVPATSAPKQTVAAGGLPKTGPEDLGLLAGFIAGGTGIFAAVRARRAKRLVAESYRSQSVI